VLMALLTTCMAGPLLHWLRAAAPASAGFPGKSVSTD
jgi:hypothetical protein